MRPAARPHRSGTWKEIELPNGSIEFKRRVLYLEDPGFDVRDDNRLMAWAEFRTTSVIPEHWQVWRNRTLNLAGVMVFRPNRRQVRLAVRP